MKLIYNFLILASAVTLFACKKEKPYDFSDTTENVKIYMAQAIGNAGFFAVNVPKPIYGKPTVNIQTFFAAFFGGFNAAPNDLNVEFVIDYKDLDSLNSIEIRNRRSLLEVMPDSILQIEKLKSMIKSGSRISDYLEFMVSSEKIQLNHRYLLPIRLSSISNNYKIDNNLKSTYFLINAVDPYVPFGGTYKSTGPINIEGDAKPDTTISVNSIFIYQGEATYKTILPFFRNNGLTLYLKVNPDNSVTILPNSGSEASTSIVENGPCSFDYDNKKFIINWKFLTSTGLSRTGKIEYKK